MARHSVTCLRRLTCLAVAQDFHALHKSDGAARGLWYVLYSRDWATLYPISDVAPFRGVAPTAGSAERRGQFCQSVWASSDLPAIPSLLADNSAFDIIYRSGLSSARGAGVRLQCAN